MESAGPFVGRPFSYPEFVMQKKCMAVILCACMALATVPLGDGAHAAPPEGKGHGNSKEKPDYV